MLSSDETLQGCNIRTDARPIKALSSRPDARFQLDAFSSLEKTFRPMVNADLVPSATRATAVEDEPA